MARRSAQRITGRITTLLKHRAGVRLDIGCGANKQDPSFIGLDYRKLPGVDIVHNLEHLPWPLPANCATAVVASHFLEHVKPWEFLKLMAEIHRVCRDGANIFVAGPYGAGYRWQQDPTHCRPLVEATFCYFDNRHPLWNVYQPPVLHIVSCERIPAGGDVDINAVLQVCKPRPGKVCNHTGEVFQAFSLKKVTPKKGKK